ncbi:molybdopterin oxidoreductase family protein [Halocatena salina]|uniref:Molybdopterin-dependent oxidoreductase n=1 Tax=Halocatena salina TaxID=2934340 RepID=A0A8U0A6V5_9EURY|nr:molybdopterin-dependent oxidoreductase [Halocatena salina]UPM44589.1 molybdopterin-dependent oxidoreductase [Halocatena salina]
MTDQPDRSINETETVCPLCAVGCRLTHGDGDRAEGCEGPANPNGRLCAKGATAFEAVRDDDRLTTPLVRRDDGLVPTDWSTALDRVVNDFETVCDASGSDALAFFGAPRCTNEENYLLQKLARSLGTNNVDNRARLCHASAATALESRFGWPASTNCLTDLTDADLLLVVGANPAIQQPVAFDAFVRPAVADGTTLVDIDPRQNETTRIADQHITPRPGTDALCFHLVCALLVEHEYVDTSFVNNRTSDYETFKAALANIDIDEGQQTTGVDSETLIALVDRIGTADRITVIGGTGIEDGGDETTTTDALLNMLLLTGNVGRPGTGFMLLRGLNNEQGAVDMGCRPDILPGHQSVTDDAARRRVADVWNTEPPSHPGRNEYEALDAFGTTVHGALVVGENPAIEKRDADWVAHQLDALETLVLLDVFPSETMQHADVVLPAAVGLEKAGTITNLDRRVQRLSVTASPPGMARTDYAILAALGEQLVGDGFAPVDPETAFDELQAVNPLYDGFSDTVGECWPVGNDDGLYTDGFATHDSKAPFVPLDPAVTSPADDELVLIVGSRAGGFDTEYTVDNRVRLNVNDATMREIEEGDHVVVATGDITVTTTAAVGDAVREGTAYLHADVADPLVRSASGSPTVTVTLAKDV